MRDLSPEENTHICQISRAMACAVIWVYIGDDGGLELFASYQGPLSFLFALEAMPDGHPTAIVRTEGN